MLNLTTAPATPETIALADPTTVSTRPGLLPDLLGLGLIDVAEWTALGEDERQQLMGGAERTDLLARLVRRRLLSPFQGAWLRTGTPAGLVLNSYGLLDRLGDGEPGTCFRAVHMRLRRPVAIKRIPLPPAREARDRAAQLLDGRLQQLASVRHPGLPEPLDCGLCRGDDPAAPFHHYQVMPLIPGMDLKQRVLEHGPLPVGQACDLAYQVASVLDALHQRRLIHHAVRPTHVMWTPEGRAVLVGAGVPDPFRRRPSPEKLAYRAPVLAADRDDLLGDLYGLGATLYWCLTGRPPYRAPTVATGPGSDPPAVRTWRPDVPAELDSVVTRLLELRPDHRYATARAVMTALIPLVSAGSVAAHGLPSMPDIRPTGSANRTDSNTCGRVLVAVQERAAREFCKYALLADGIRCDDADTGRQALRLLASRAYDVMFVDPRLPELSPRHLAAHLRSSPSSRNLKTISLGSAGDEDGCSEAPAKTDDIVLMPVHARRVVEQVQGLLRLKEIEDRSDLLGRHWLAANQQLEDALCDRERSLAHARRGLALALAKLVACRDEETGAHLLRMQRYCRRLAEAARDLPNLTEPIDTRFLDALDCAVPLHDIGKIGLPDYILFKSAPLTVEERRLLERHPQTGADLLREVARRHGPAFDFLPMAVTVARHHHERFDGNGYPDRLAGEAIPLAARIVAVADVYDALRSRRPYKPAMSHVDALRVMDDNAEGQFDPALFRTFRRHAGDFEQIYRELTD